MTAHMAFPSPLPTEEAPHLGLFPGTPAPTRAAGADARPVEVLAMLTGEELAKAMPLCADTSRAGSRHWLRAERPIDPQVLAAAIHEYEARS